MEGAACWLQGLLSWGDPLEGCSGLQPALCRRSTCCLLAFSPSSSVGLSAPPPLTAIVFFPLSGGLTPNRLPGFPHPSLTGKKISALCSHLSVSLFSRSRPSVPICFPFKYTLSLELSDCSHFFSGASAWQRRRRQRKGTHLSS